jgi:hypothetical protein
MNMKYWCQTEKGEMGVFIYLADTDIPSLGN